MPETQTKSRKGIGGPKTREGKERVRLNALKTGLYADSIEGMQAVADVIGVTFESMHQEMRAYYQPADPLEEVLVRRIARCSWKLIVIESIEDVKLKGLMISQAPGPSLESLSIMLVFRDFGLPVPGKLDRTQIPKHRNGQPVISPYTLRPRFSPCRM